MRFMQWAKDGGEESHVNGLYIIEIKKLFSVVLLHFTNGSREAYHTHAFNALTWVLKGAMHEHRPIMRSDVMVGVNQKTFERGLKPKLTKRDCLHKVVSAGDTWALTFRGPWVDMWREYLPALRRFVTLTHGRKVVA